jgi:hypothetical protein
MSKQISQLLIDAIKENKVEIGKMVTERPNWEMATQKFDTFFKSISDPKDPLWSEGTINKLNEVYFVQRNKDKGMSNITLRTVTGMPDHLKNDMKKIFLQTAEVCSIFNASHKVNFENNELPEDYPAIKIIPSKTKGFSILAHPLPSLYKKTSLTFDYWIPKVLEWTLEIRGKKLKDWKGDAILQHESCTDFMRICLQFLSDTTANPPVAKAEDREALLNLLGEEFIWIKKSAKREEIKTNSSKIVDGFGQLTRLTGIDIPLEAWCRILYASFAKSLIK